MIAPEQIDTQRLSLRRPARSDVDAIFVRYASDVEVTRYLSWRRHCAVKDTQLFLDFSDSEWHYQGCGPYLVTSRATGQLLGGTGLTLEGAGVAQTGYVFARDAWGHGYATESLHAIVDLATSLALERLRAQCHPDHHASVHVLEKCGFRFESRMAKALLFPNLTPRRQDVLSYEMELRSVAGGAPHARHGRTQRRNGETEDERGE